MVDTAKLPAQIGARIVAIRGLRVIIDADLAELYGVRTKVLLQAVKRNLERFPSDFMITVENQDLVALRSQIVTSKTAGRGGRRYSFKAFTEHGAVMAATVLNSPSAIAMSILVVRAFVAMRASLMWHADVVKKLDDLERRVEQRLGAQDGAIEDILEAIRKLMTPPERPGRGIGFVR